MKTRNPLNNWLLAVAIIAIVVFTFFGCSKQPIEPAVQKPEVVTLRLGYRPQALADVTPVVMREMATNTPGLRLEFVPLSSPDDGFTKFKAREIDAIAGMPMEKIFQQLASTNDARRFEAYYFQVDIPNNGWVSLVGNKNMGIQKISDLANKNVASLNTDQAQYLVRQILQAAGIPSDQIKITKYNPATAMAGLRSGEYAALFGLEPAISIAADEGNPILAKGPVAAFMFSGRAVPLSASVISLEFANMHPEAKKQFLLSVAEAVDVVSKHPEQVRRYFQRRENGELSQSVAARLNLPEMRPPTSELKSVTEEFVQRLVKDGVLKQSVDLTPLFPK